MTNNDLLYRPWVKKTRRVVAGGLAFSLTAAVAIEIHQSTPLDGPDFDQPSPFVTFERTATPSSTSAGGAGGGHPGYERTELPVLSLATTSATSSSRSGRLVVGDLFSIAST